MGTVVVVDRTVREFRKTTEDGVTVGSRAKGLHGKRRAGVGDSMLETSNSRDQRVGVGVRLQQVAGPEVNVYFKLFAIQGLPMS